MVPGAEVAVPSAILQPTGVGSHGSGWSQVGGTGGQKHTAVDPGDPIVHDDDSSYLQVGFPDSVGQSLAYEALTTVVPTAKEVVEVRRHVRIRRTTDVEVDPDKLAAVIHRVATDTTLGGPEGTPGEAATAFYGPSYVEFSFVAFNPEASSGKWTTDACDRLESFDQRTNDDAPSEFVRVTSSWYVIQYLESVTTVQGADEAARRRLIRYRNPEQAFQQVVGPRGERANLWEDVQFVEPFGPDAEGKGFGAEQWERRLLRPTVKTIDLDTGAVTLRMLDPRRDLTTFFLQGQSDKPGSLDGAVLFDNGNVGSFSRASKAWLRWPDQRAYEIPSGYGKWTEKGLLFERSRTNRILNSAFHVDGAGGSDLFASWTELLSAAGISKLTSNPYFDRTIQKQYPQIAQTSPAAARGLQFTTSSIAANTWCVLQVVHRDVGSSGADKLGIVVRNDGTGNYLQPSLSSWGGSTVIYPWAHAASRVFDWLAFQLEGMGGTLTIQLRADMNDTTAVHRIWQVDGIDDIDYPTSSIYTTTAEVTELADDWSFSQGLGQEAIPIDGSQYVIQAIVRPRFSSDSQAHPRYGGFGQDGSGLWTVKQGSFASSRVWFDYSGGNPLRLAMNSEDFGIPKGGGRLEDLEWNENDRIAVVYRASSLKGEHDLLPGQAHMMAKNLTQGSVWHESARRSQIALSPTNVSTLLVGQMQGSLFQVPLDGWLEFLRVSPIVLPQAEAKAFP